GINFFSELKPGGLKENGPAVATQSALTMTQLEALRMVLAKEVAAERDAAARFLPWLATFGSVSPLLGLLGTVLGVMDAFIGIAVGGSGNIAAVAPGVAEALVTHVGGLAVAVPSVMAYHRFVNRLRLFGGEVEGLARELRGPRRQHPRRPGAPRQGGFRGYVRPIRRDQTAAGGVPRADGRVPYANVVQVLAVIRQSGVSDVGLVAEPEHVER